MSVALSALTMHATLCLVPLSGDAGFFSHLLDWNIQTFKMLCAFFIVDFVLRCFLAKKEGCGKKKKVQKFARGKVQSIPYLKCRTGTAWTVKAGFWTQWSGLSLKTWRHQSAVPWSLQCRSSWYQQIGIITTAFSENFNTHSSSSTVQRSSFTWTIW